MGVKRGEFMTIDGAITSVEFSGENVIDGTLKMGVPPVTISMAAGPHKFCGFKSTTAVINVLTSEPIVDLYSASATGVSVLIKKGTAVIFKGYVVPFSFDQDYDGVETTVSINAVDGITARKGEKYVKVLDNDSYYAVDRTALRIVSAISARNGYPRMYLHYNFDTPGNNSMPSSSPLDVMVAQAGFLQDRLSDAEVLDCICRYFGHSACVCGDDLYLYDEHCLLYAGDGYRYNVAMFGVSSNGANSRVKNYYRSDDTPYRLQNIYPSLVRSGISMSVERGYSGVRVKLNGSDTNVLLPDVCGDGQYSNTPPLGLKTDIYSGFLTEGNTNRQASRRALGSLTLNTTEFANDGVDKMKPGANQALWENGSILEQVVSKKQEKNGDEWRKVAETKERLLWVRMRTNGNVGDSVTMFTQKAEAYSHNGGRIKVSVGGFGSDYRYPINAASGASTLRFLQLYVDGGFIKEKSEGSSEYVIGDGNYARSPFSLYNGKMEYIIDTGYSNSPIYVAGHTKFEWVSGDQIFINSLKIESIGDSINPEVLEIVTEEGDVLEVECLLTTRKSGYKQNELLPSGDYAMGFNARPSVVSGGWKGGYMGRAYAHEEPNPVPGIILEQLATRYSSPRIAFKMRVNTKVKPYAPVYWSGGHYTVDAYDWDVRDNTTTITID